MAERVKLEKTKYSGIYRRPGKTKDSFIIIVRENGKQRWETHPTITAARKAKSARETDRDRGELQERSKVTLAEFATEWVDRYQGRGRRGFREESREDYRRQIKQYVIPFFGERARLTQITPSDIAKFVGWLCDGRAQAKNDHAIAVQRAREAGKKEPGPLALDAKRDMSDATIRNVMSPLRACLGTAVREGKLRSNPALGIDLPHREQIVEDEDHDARAFTREELATFLSLVVDRRWQTFFRLIASTGLRFSEVIGLEWRHVHLDGSKPHLKIRQRIVKGRVGPPKSRHGRRNVPLPHSLVVELRHLRSTTEYAGDKNPVFASRTGTPLMYGNVFRRHLKPVAEEAGVPWAGFHTFRHTCASMLIAEGRNIVQVSRWLGHHSPAFTLSTYAHLMDDGIGAALDIDGPQSGPTDAPESGPSTIDAAELDALLSES